MLVVLSLFALAAIAADVIARLVIAPNRKDRHYEELLESLVEPEPLAHVPTVNTSDPTLVRLTENLLRHFGHLAVSRRVLEALADEDDGRMSESDVLAAVNRSLQAVNKPPLPAPALRKVLRILARADFVALRGGILHITDTGRHLHAALCARGQQLVPEPVLVAS